jgi:hypothetical protein
MREHVSFSRIFEVLLVSMDSRNQNPHPKVSNLWHPRALRVLSEKMQQAIDEYC